MALPPFIHIWIFITALLVQSLYAQHIDVLAPQPVIHGEINGMKVVAQGDAVAFFAAGKPSLLLGDEECAHDLNCTMQTNRTEAVVLNPEGVWLFETPEMYAPENVTITEPLSPVSTEQGFSAGTFIKPTPTHIPLAFPHPTATLHTGNEVVDKTPGILLVSTPVREWLAETISTSGLVEQMPTRSSAETLSPIIEPSPTQQRVMFTTISQEENELLRKLISTVTTPMPTPVPTGIENQWWEDGSIRLEMETDILTIKPSPSGQYGSNSKTTGSFTFSVKQVPTVTKDGAGTTDSSNERTTSTETGSTTDTPQATSLPSSVLQANKAGATKAECLDEKTVVPTEDSEKAQPVWRLLLPSPLELLVAAKTSADFTIDQKRKILSYLRGIGAYALDKEEYTDEEIEDIFDPATKRRGGIQLGYRCLSDRDLGLGIETCFDDGWSRTDFDGATSLKTPDYLNPDYFKRLLAEKPSQDQVVEISKRSVLAKEPLIRPTGLPEIEKDTLKALVLYRIQQQYRPDELEDLTNPGHLPPLSVREIRNLITRCALPEVELVRLVGVSQTVGGDAIDNTFRDSLLKALLKRLHTGAGADQSLFDRGGKLEHWRYIPEYSADEKREVLVKKNTELGTLA